MLDALRNEHAALTERIPAGIEKAVNAKQEHLAKFETCEHARKRWLKQAGVAEENSVIREFLSEQDENAQELIPLWDQLLDTAQQCRKQNQANGALVEVHRRHVQRALDLLRGTEETPTYGPGGETRDRNDTHSLAKA